MKEVFSKKSNMLLDCTLRDGGYYNSWDFDAKVVSRYLQSVQAAGIDVIEIGFRLPPQNKFLGAFAYSTDRFLSKLPLSEDCLIAVMTNAKDFIGYGGGPPRAVADMFDERTNSPLDIVRICSYFDAVPDAKPIPQLLKELGYKVCFNLMQVGGKTPCQIKKVVSEIQKWQTVDVLYFADSLGSMDVNDIKMVIDIIKDNWNGLIGIHAHDNKGRALANTISAIENDCNWVDGTILGMGRGAGNTRTEHLLLELKQKGYDKYDPESVFTIVMEDFNSLRQKFGWGHNLLYYLSASYGIHPTYVQEMISALRYDSYQILEALKTLRRWEASAYSQDHLREAMIGRIKVVDGKWSAADWVTDRDVLVIGPGPGARKHLSAITDYIEQYKPFVICLNSNTVVPNNLIDTYAVCHHTRLLTELNRYTSFDRPILMPFGILPESIQKKISDLSVLDYGVHVESGKFEMRNTNCTIPGLLVAPYVFAAATVGGANRILLAGFDGYGPADPRQEEMVEVINCYRKLPQSLPLVAITPSTYGVEQSSVYL